MMADGYYVTCEKCGGSGSVPQYDMIRDEVHMVDCRYCNGTGEIFIESEE